jgi:hypothetical protein
MNLFWKRILGQMKSTAKMEAEFAVLTADFKRYCDIEASKELAEYRELFEKVRSAEFQEKKKTLVNRKYRDTQEYRDLQKFNRLNNNSKIARYYKILDDPQLAEYLEFRKSADYVLLGKISALLKNPELRRWKKFEHTAEFKSYMRFHNSYVIKEFEALREKVSTPEFKEANAFWSNPHRWEKTEEAAIERRFNDLARNEDIKFYESIDSTKFARLRQYHQTFFDSFDWNSLNASRWESGFNYPGDKFVGNHSFTNEKQANNNGDNTSVVAGELSIVTRRERKLALAWDKTRGFVNHQFEFTSDVLHGTKGVWQKGGYFRAKIRFEGKDLTQAFWLTGERILPHINIAVCDGKSIEVGTHWATKFEQKYTSTKVTGLKLSDYYIYSLEWTEKELIWRINNIEVLRTTEGVPTEPLFPMLSAFISQNQKGGEGRMQVDWIEAWIANK